MKNLIKSLIILFFFLFLAKPTMAQNVADHSAKMLKIEAKNLDSIRIAKKKLAITRVLNRYNSPLINSVDSFMLTCQNYSLDCYLLPSITGLESSFGQFTHPDSYNPFGWGGGFIIFDDWNEAIDTVGKGLKQNYINKGAETVDEIAPIYAASKTWAPRVKLFLATFEKEEAKIESILEKNIVQL